MFIVEFYQDGEWVVLDSSDSAFDACEAAEGLEHSYSGDYPVRVRWVD